MSEARVDKNMLPWVHREIWLRLLQRRLKNRDFSIITNNCVGGMIYKELGLQFLSPTIKLRIKPDDFIRLCLNLKYYMGQELVEVATEKDYPVGRIDDVRIHFLHYSSFEEARDTWNRRKERIRYDNIFVIMKQGKSMTPQSREAFQSIPYPKVLLVSQPTERSNEFYISGCEEKGYLRDLTEYQRPGVRYFEQFDFVSFLNQGRLIDD